MPTKIVISGATGRMGQTLVSLIAQENDFELIGGIARTERSGHPRIVPVQAAAELIRAADVIVDFSAVAGLHELLTLRADELAGKGIVVGTTGLTPEVQQQLDRTAATSPVIAAANFSVGVNLVLGLVEAAARVLDAGRYDVEITEAHHRRKVDAPSGTALALGKAIAKARGAALESVRKDGRSGHTGVRNRGEIGFHALRAGEIVGEHRVHFIGAREHIEIAHRAQDRSLFAEGALVAAQWSVGRTPGSYSMKEVLGLTSLTPGA